MRAALAGAVLAAAIALAACGLGGEEVDWVRVELDSGRAYLLDPGPDEPAEGAPLVVGLHGIGTGAEAFVRFSGLSDLHERGVVLAYGDALDKVENAWNAGGCCSADPSVDDVGYLVEVVADVRRRVPEVDPRRVYVVGFSNGAMMALRALCERPDVFAAAAGVAGGLAAPCESDRPLRYLHLHGRRDQDVPYRGGYERWLDATFIPTPDLRDEIRSTAPGSRVEVRTYECGHVWPEADDCGLDAVATTWAFLEPLRREP